MEIQKDLLRFATIGNVDDGKSTLIGRLLYDTKSIYQDQLDYVQRTSEKFGGSKFNLALLTDGLRAEKEQGITIDVAHRFMETSKRKFIIHDCPGHVQYTRNMVTGISNVNLAIALIDARNGLQEQTKRHSLICSMMGIKHLVIAINKMDLVNYSEAVFERIKEDFSSYSSKLEISDVQFIPISALEGDNIVLSSSKMEWYKGPSLIYILENIHISSDQNLIDCRFPIQGVIRTDSSAHPDYRAFYGQIESGIFKAGDEVMVFPNKRLTKIQKIELNGNEIAEAFPPMSANIILEDDCDGERGSMIVKPHNQPEEATELNILFCWLADSPFNPRTKYLAKHTTKTVQTKTIEVNYKINISSLHREVGTNIFTNDVARIRVKTSSPLFVDAFRKNKATGSLILIDPVSLNTVAAGLVLET